MRDSAYHIIGYKGATYYAIGLALVRTVGAILRNERSVLTVSSLLDGEFGLRDVCLSVPCIVSTGRVDNIIGDISIPRREPRYRHRPPCYGRRFKAWTRPVMLSSGKLNGCSLPHS